MSPAACFPPCEGRFLNLGSAADPMPLPQPPAHPHVLARDAWQERMRAHATRVGQRADALLERRSRDLKHPVHDFLFTYYNFPPAKLKRWLPALGQDLEVSDEDVAAMPWLVEAPMIREERACRLDPGQMPSKVADLAVWVAALCRAILDRPPRFRCFGLHEWAMVYRLPREKIRHQGYELRLHPDQVASVVDSMAVCCSHYDAYRFFAPEALPMNTLRPTLESRIDLEQGGCLHTNMDLYKWSSKLWPWIGSDLVGECFDLAWAGRDLDMRASPYDLVHLGYEPVLIETAEGRQQYEAEQRDLAARAAELRQRLQEGAAVLARHGKAG